MKRIIFIILAALTCAAFVGCGSSSERRTSQGSQIKSVEDVLNEGITGYQTQDSPSTKASETASAAVQSSGLEAVDIDLTKMSSTMVYSEVYNMMISPDDYLGKRVRMRGDFAYAEVEGKYYYACIISDATACCAQGIEFVLNDERKFPDDYPSVGTEITVAGVFDVYKEGMFDYCQLIDAVME